MRETMQRLQSISIVLAGAVAVAVAFAIVIDAVRLSLWSDALGLLSSVQDDSFYYILPAHNFAHGKGFTFGGELSYGFQPGYAVVLAILGSLFESPLELFRASLVLNGLLFVGVGVLLFASLRTSAVDGADAGRNLTLNVLPGALAATVYISNSWSYLTSTTGKENALAAFLLAAMIYCTMAWRRRAKVISPIIVGSLMGALFITRIAPSTMIYFVMFLIFYIKEWRSYALSACVIPLVWFLYAALFLGGALPYSLLVKSAAPGHEFGLHTIAGAIEYVFNSVKFALLGYGDVQVPQPDQGGATGNVATKLGLSLVFVVALLWQARAIWLAWKARDGWGKGRLDFDRLFPVALVLAALVGSAVMATGILLKRPDEAYYASWYFFDWPVVLSLFLGISLRELLQASQQGPKPLVRHLPAISISCVVIIAASTAAIFHLSRKPYSSDDFEEGISVRWQNTMIASALWLKENRPDWADSTIAAYSAGALGMVLDDRVINLDGLSNNAVARDMIEHGSIEPFLLKSQPKYYVDVGAALPKFEGVTATRAHTFEFASWDGYVVAELTYAAKPADSVDQPNASGDEPEPSNR